VVVLVSPRLITRWRINDKPITIFLKSERPARKGKPSITAIDGSLKCKENVKFSILALF